MIMDVPSPQSVGREFVRQYYTLLNKAPDHLHRFYNNNSSFVHGGLDPHNREATMVIGQKQIYNKIQQLRFRDCHAKISQVDAQQTLGGGVVVQVTGELSNNGEPMRRFTQTFVLAAQSPKKYYVHNDIFRYQDLITDDENEVESRSENDDEQEQDSGLSVDSKQQPQQPQQQAQQAIFYPTQMGSVQSYQQPAQLNGVIQHEEILQNLTTSNNNVAINNINNNTNAHTQILQSQSLSAAQQQIIPDQLSSVTGPPNAAINNDLDNASSPALQNDLEQQHDVNIRGVTEIESKDELANVQNDQMNSVNDDESLSKASQNEPKTYAQFFKTDNFSMNFSQTTSSTTGRSPNTTNNTVNSTRNSNTSRPTNQIRERRSSNANQFGDNHQLFLGNVPHHATEEELKIMFGRFGTVVDLRIHSKPGPKMPGMRAPQNYGFITYDDPESVQNCLANTPLYYPENSPDGQKLNVEEKKARMRNENMNSNDRNDRDRNDRGLNRTISGGQRNSGDRDRGIGLNRNSNTRTGGGGGGGRPFNRNDRQQGPRGNNNNSTTSSGNGNGYGRR